MITCELEDMPKEAESELRKWLAKEPPIKNLNRVLEAKVKYYQAMALREALQSGPENLKLNAANSSLLSAQRYQHAIDVLQEFTDLQSPYQIAKLT